MSVQTFVSHYIISHLVNMELNFLEVFAFDNITFQILYSSALNLSVCRYGADLSA